MLVKDLVCNVEILYLFIFVCLFANYVKKTWYAY